MCSSMRTFLKPALPTLGTGSNILETKIAVYTTRTTDEKKWRVFDLVVIAREAFYRWLNFLFLPDITTSMQYFCFLNDSLAARPWFRTINYCE